MNAGTFFNPNGRMSRGQFQSAFLVLVVLGFINALSALAPAAAALAVGSLSFFIGLVLAYMWVAIWIKRLHNADVTGWMTILIVLGWLIISMVVGTTIQMVLAPESMQMGASGGSFAEIMAASQEASRQIAIPNAIAGAVVSGVYAFILNAALKNDPEENKFGLAPS
jgi:uncharacterized membrane protein YhaH (DUF805 family)